MYTSPAWRRQRVGTTIDRLALQVVKVLGDAKLLVEVLCLYAEPLLAPAADAEHIVCPAIGCLECHLLPYGEEAIAEGVYVENNT